MSKKLFLLDALALVFRAYYALIRNPRITSKGKNTNAQFGFTNTLLELINNQKPTHLAVCFDTEAPTERHTDFVDYKANRQEAPEDLIAALPDIKKIIQGFNVPVVELDGYEADDIIGTLSKLAAKEGYEVFMVTSDKAKESNDPDHSENDPEDVVIDGEQRQEWLLGQVQAAAFPVICPKG